MIERLHVQFACKTENFQGLGIKGGIAWAGQCCKFYLHVTISLPPKNPDYNFWYNQRIFF